VKKGPPQPEKPPQNGKITFVKKALRRVPYNSEKITRFSLSLFITRFLTNVLRED
jgi:hypothetical protein